MKRITILFTLILVIGIQTAMAQTWNIGAPPRSTSVTATLSDGTLTISGEGAMNNALSGGAPWYPPSYSTWYFRSSITTVIIEDGVTNIGNWMFYDLTGLTSVTIPNSVTSIGDNAFRNCISLTSVTIPESVTSMGKWIFYGCTGLTSIVIPEGVTSIETDAFTGCRSLTSVTIPESVTSIGIGAFEGCINLTSITIPESVTSIGFMAFAGTGLTSITIPNGVIIIESAVFMGCINLTSITIPESVDSIGFLAFVNAGLTSVISLNPVPPTNAIYAFSSETQETACLYVPQSSVHLYNEADGWKDFNCIKSTAEFVSVLSQSRVIPQLNPESESSVKAQTTALSSKFTVGPNPVSKQSGGVNLFWQGERIQSATLTIFDASGRVINKIKITDNALDTQERRIVGFWDLTDRKGRLVSEGTYLVRGVVIDVDGKKERVSVMVGIR